MKMIPSSDLGSQQLNDVDFGLIQINLRGENFNDRGRAKPVALLLDPQILTGDVSNQYEVSADGRFETFEP